MKKKFLKFKDCLRPSVRILRIKSVSLCKGLSMGWPLLVIYLGFVQSLVFLKFGVNALILEWVAFLSPLFVLGISFAFYELKAQVFALVLAILGNIVLGALNLFCLYAELKLRLVGGLNAVFIGYFKEQAGFFWVLDLSPLVAGLIAARYLWSQPVLRYRLKARRLGKSNNFGSAKLADSKTLERLNDREGLPIGAFPEIDKFEDVKKVIEAIQQKPGGELVRLKADHTTVVAPSGAGKGIGIVIPALLDYKGSVFVTDIKGENYSVTHRAREARGRKVIAFDPFEITVAPKTCINPLDFLKADRKSIVDDAAILAHLICQTRAQDGTNADYFQSQGGAVVQCLLLYVVCSNDIQAENKNLACVFDLLCSPVEDLMELFKKIGQEEMLGYGAAARLANRIVSTDPRELSGILNSAFVEMRFVDTPYVRESTSHSTVNIAEITTGNLDLFVCIPPEKLDAQSRLLRLFTGIVFLEMQQAKGKVGDCNLLMLIDEMPALEHIKQIEQILKYGRGYGISLMAIAQTIEGVQAVYPKTWRTFFSNPLILFFGCTDDMTCELVSKMAGDRTVETHSSNQGSGKQSRAMDILGNVSTQVGTTVSETGRRILKLEDVRTLGAKVMLAFMRGEDLILCQRIDYRERAEWKEGWDENPLHANRFKEIPKKLNNKINFLKTDDFSKEFDIL